MRPADAFEITHERYQQCKQLTVKLGAINPAACAKQETQRAPQITKVMAFCLDFELAGGKALKGHQKRLLMFQFHFCGQGDKERTKKALRIGESTFWYWSGEIKKAVGRELRKRGLYPPGNYFNSVTVERSSHFQI